MWSLTRRPTDTARTDHSTAERNRAGTNLVRTGGRVVVWTVIALVFVRGLGTIFGSAEPVDRPTDQAGSAFPDAAEAEALAVRFAAAYLDTSRPQRRAKRLASLAPTLRDQTPSPSSGPGSKVAMATVARSQRLGGRAMITVATTSVTGVERDLVVPVARDRHGRPHVIGAPALVPPTPRGDAQPDRTEELTGSQATAVRDLVRRFLPLYLGGSDVRYYLAPGTRLVPFSRGLSVVSVERIVADRDVRTAHGELAVIVSATVRDDASPATYRLDYPLRVARTDRWYVTAVIGGPTS